MKNKPKFLVFGYKISKIETIFLSFFVCKFFCPFNRNHEFYLSS